MDERTKEEMQKMVDACERFLPPADDLTMSGFWEMCFLRSLQHLNAYPAAQEAYRGMLLMAELERRRKEAENGS